MTPYRKKIQNKNKVTNKKKLAKKRNIQNLAIKKNEFGVTHILHINSTINNTRATLTDNEGNVIIGKTAGNVGFKKSQRSSTYAAQLIGEFMADYMTKSKVKQLGIHLNGIGKGQIFVIKGLRITMRELKSRVRVRYLRDVTVIPHNGCRPRKTRRR